MASETPATASQLLEALDQGRCSAEELVRDCLARIEAEDGALNSFITVDAEGALAAARAAFWSSKKKDTRVLPHVVNGLYDTSWHARNVSSWSDIRKLAPRDGWTAALVVAADDVETPCDDQHEQCASWAAAASRPLRPGTGRPGRCCGCEAIW